MGILRPATPGFLVTLAAAVLLAIVSFSVPYFKAIFFLKASLSDQGINGSITFGTLGYCLELPNGTTCTKPRVGYELDINALVGNDLPIQIPQVVVKWITYALVLHIVGLILAAISAFFGLLAHVREFSMTCFSTCISGFAAAVTLVAFIFDLAFFFIAKSRINSVKGGSASMGTAIWMTLAAWLLLFFAGCFFGLGRCCISRRPRDLERRKPSVDDHYAEQVRLDAVKAEADRKARQQRQEVGLPAFQEYEQTKPLTADPDEYIDDGEQVLPYRSNQRTPPAGGAGVGAGMAAYNRTGPSPPAGGHPVGYSQAPAGNRAVDDYYNQRPSQANAYPPQPRRQGSGHTQSSSAYSQSTYHTTSPPPPVPTIPPPPSGTNPANAAYLMPGAYGHSQYSSAASQQEYGHDARGATYQSAASHQQYATDYSAYHPEQPQAFNADTYNATAHMAMPSSTSAFADPYAPNPTYSQPTPSQQPYLATTQQHLTPERSYTLGGDAYDAAGASTAQNPYADDAYYARYSGSSHMPSPYSPLPTPSPSRLDTNVAAAPGPASATSPRGPRTPRSPIQPPQSPSPSHATSHQPQGSHILEPVYEDQPPVYDVATAQPPGQYDTKH
ncbi:Pali-domain-containing protein [Phanerochaete sordida]|uniref:Pali-domain-containing protein n=1 Tax=Phanerochaete sordida TaxID=48140 RepID=A0A9P3G098_9APHY|nr:Pali-domain-containing protein [Phanerochaete sordida]